jgi:hypothetical protein
LLGVPPVGLVSAVRVARAVADAGGDSTFVGSGVAVRAAALTFARVGNVVGMGEASD